MTNTAVIGFGYWGKNLIRNFHELGSLRLVCDADPAREEVMQSTYPGVGFCQQLEDVLQSAEIDGVVIATPAVTHFAVAKAALEAGKDVFVEKPLALSEEQGQQLVDLAAERDRILMVGHILQYHPAVKKLKELIHNGELGRIEYLYSNRLNIGKFRTEENILWSFAPHDISVMLALLDEEPREIFCQGGNYLNGHIADVTMSQFVFPSGVRAHIFVSWLHPFKEQRLVVVGSEKMAVFDDTAEHKLLLYPHHVVWRNRVPTAIKADAEKVEIEAIEPLRAECEHFLKCIQSRKTPLTDGREGLRVLRVLSTCEARLQSAPVWHRTPCGETRGEIRALGADNKNTARSAVPREDAVWHRTPCGEKREETAPPREASDADKKNTARSAVPREETAAAPYYAHETACIDDGAQVGAGTKIWHYSHVMKNARIGRNCSLGQNCVVSPGVVIGDNVKVQNNVSIYTGVEIEDDVFLGPSCVLTNVTNPRSQINRRSLYERTILRRGATIGANATIVCGIEIGRYAFVAAGAVVTRSVPDYALMVGNPARQAGWMSRHGHKLTSLDGTMVCPESGLRYELDGGRLRCIDLDEDAPLPPDKTIGTRDYDSFKQEKT